MKRALLLAALVACEGGKTVGAPMEPKTTDAKPAPKPTEGAATTTTLGADDDGRTVEVAVGATVVVALASNPTTGFNWHVVESPGALGAPESTFERPSAPGEGAGGRQRFTWRAVPVGEHEVSLIYRRGPNEAPLQTFRAKIRAR